MKCATCPQEFVIRTDPKGGDYEFVSGIRRINSMPTPDQAETIGLKDDKTMERLETDAFFRLEHEEEDKRKSSADRSVVARLQKISDDNHRNDYLLNRRLRDRVRGGRKQRKELAEEGRKLGFGFALLPVAPEDSAKANAVKYRSRKMNGQTEIASDSTALKVSNSQSTALARVLPGKPKARSQSVAVAPRKRKSNEMHTAALSKGLLKGTTKKQILSATQDTAREIQKRRRFEIRAGSIFGSSSKAQTTAAKLAALHAKRRRIGIKAKHLKLVQRGRR